MLTAGTVRFLNCCLSFPMAWPATARCAAGPTLKRVVPGCDSFPVCIVIPVRLFVSRATRVPDVGAHLGTIIQLQGIQNRLPSTPREFAPKWMRSGLR